jgi:hypothetical protein
MTARSLAKMSVDALLTLRDQIDDRLAQWRVNLEEQIARLGSGGRALQQLVMSQLFLFASQRVIRPRALRISLDNGIEGSAPARGDG